MFSALKVAGQKLYRLAREGQTLELEPRPVTIKSLRVWRDAPTSQDLHFHVACSKVGTRVQGFGVLGVRVLAEEVKQNGQTPAPAPTSQDPPLHGLLQDLYWGGRGGGVCQGSVFRGAGG